MELGDAVEEKVKKECVLMPVTPAKPVPLRLCGLLSGTDIGRNVHASACSHPLPCVNDSIGLFNAETSDRSQENNLGMIDLDPSASSINFQTSSGVCSHQFTGCESERKRAGASLDSPSLGNSPEFLESHNNIGVSIHGASGKAVSDDPQGLEMNRVDSNVDAPHVGMAGSERAGVATPVQKSILKRRLPKGSTVKTYRPKILDESKPAKIRKVQSENREVAQKHQDKKKRRYEKRSSRASINSKTPISEIGDQLQCLKPQTPEPLLPKHATSCAKSCRRSLDFSMETEMQNEEFYHDQSSNKIGDKPSLKWDFSLNLQPQDFDDCVELKQIISEYRRGKKKRGVNLSCRTQDICSVVSNDEIEKKSDLPKGRDSTIYLGCWRVLQYNGKSFPKNYKKKRLTRRRVENCDILWKSIIANEGCTDIKGHKRISKRRLAALSNSTDSLDYVYSSTRQMSRASTSVSKVSSIPLLDFSLVKRKRRSWLPSTAVKESTECNDDDQFNSAECNGIKACPLRHDALTQASSLVKMVPKLFHYPLPEKSMPSDNDIAANSQENAVQNPCVDDASAKKLIDPINQELGPQVISAEHNQLVVRDQNIQGALVVSERKTSNKKMVFRAEHNQLVVRDQNIQSALVVSKRKISKEKKPQLKVDIDPESMRMWRLLTENEGITPEEEKENEAWRKQTELFRGRVEEFIASMHKFLGNRRFTPWKGSVTDSVIGTILTQNVSDFLSSSAFMCLRAKYPPKCTRNHGDSNGDKTLSSVSVEDCTEVDMQAKDANNEHCHTFGTKQDVESSSFTCKTPAHETSVLEKAKASKDTLQMEENSFLERFYDHQNRDVPSGSVRRQLWASSSEAVILKGEHHNSVINNQVQIYQSKKKSERKSQRVEEEKKPIDWDQLRRSYSSKARDGTGNNLDSVDWEAVRRAPVKEVAETIAQRGQQNILASRIKDFLNRLVKDHGSTDLEWLRDVPPGKAKEFLLSINGIGLKSMECIRLLTLHHKAFPVDTNVGRVAVRLGWIPLKPLPKDLQFHVLSQYPPMDEIQKYLWPRLCSLDQRTLYELHYQLITFGKVFCTKAAPNCNGCPKSTTCRHKASKDASDRLRLPGPQQRSIVTSKASVSADFGSTGHVPPSILPLPDSRIQESGYRHVECEPIVEFPESPELDPGETHVTDIEDSLFDSVDDDMTFYNLNNTEEFNGNYLDMLDKIGDASQASVAVSTEDASSSRSRPEEFNRNYLHVLDKMENVSQALVAVSTEDASRSKPEELNGNSPHILEKMEDVSQALVSLSTEYASRSKPKLKYVERLRTEHHVYELPDGHPLVANLAKREHGDPCPYLFAISATDESSSSSKQFSQPLKPQALDLNDLPTCFGDGYSEVQDKQQMVQGTILVPCRTALKGNFPLNGTYFQVNEVFADHESSQNLISVPREWLWNLPRRMLFCGTSATSIIKGLTKEEVRYCFWRGFICVRGFARETGAPKGLAEYFHRTTTMAAKKKEEEKKVVDAQ